jgi:hypothetical protein
MDTAFGFVGKDFVILAADGSESYSILKMKVRSSSNFFSFLSEILLLNV